MEALLPNFITIITTLLASGGFWAFMSTRQTKRDKENQKDRAETRLLLGIAHDRIIHLGMSYINRGWMTKDEFEDLHKYLWEPYSEFGGNGLAQRVMEDVKKLPFRGRMRIHVEAKNEYTEKEQSSEQPDVQRA